MMNTTSTPNRGRVDVSITNLSPADEKFIRNVVSLFADPDLSKHADDFRNGRTRLAYEGTGAMTVRIHAANGKASR